MNTQTIGKLISETNLGELADSLSGDRAVIRVGEQSTEVSGLTAKTLDYIGPDKREFGGRVHEKSEDLQALESLGVIVIEHSWVGNENPLFGGSGPSYLVSKGPEYNNARVTGTKVGPGWKFWEESRFVPLEGN